MSSLTSSDLMNATTKSPLHFLAHVALHFADRPDGATLFLDECSKPSGSTAPPFTVVESHARYLGSLHIPCILPVSTVFTEPKPLKRSSTSNSLHTIESTSSGSSFSTKPSKRQMRHTSRPQLKARAEMKAKRKELMERALKIKSLENSPVNDRQLIVLRMIYDEITMYPSESWMVLIAIIIHRAFKQVKNWFSNERQKQKAGEVVSVHASTGEKMRLRPLALQFCQEWSDSFFEEVVMVHHYKTLRCLRWKETQSTKTAMPSVS